MKRWAPEEGPVWAWRAGQIAQGIVMGAMLVIAVVGLLAVAGDVTAFSYQGY